MQHEQDAVEGGLIAHCELACATFGGGSEGGDQGLQLQPQFFANGLSCHEGMKHNCFMRVSWAVVLATLRVLYFPFSETTPALTLESVVGLVCSSFQQVFAERLR